MTEWWAVSRSNTAVPLVLREIYTNPEFNLFYCLWHLHYWVVCFCRALVCRANVLLLMYSLYVMYKMLKKSVPKNDSIEYQIILLTQIYLQWIVKTCYETTSIKYHSCFWKQTIGSQITREISSWIFSQAKYQRCDSAMSNSCKSILKLGSAHKPYPNNSVNIQLLWSADPP